MDGMPTSIEAALRRFQRRLALGLFLDIWPSWGVASLLAAGVLALACRLLWPAVSPMLPWLWLAPILVTLPVAVLCVLRRYRLSEAAALADSLSGGHGLLLAELEQRDPSWYDSPMLEAAVNVELPRLRPWRKLAPLGVAAVFLAAALAIPQRVAVTGNDLLAEEIAGNLAATLQDLKQQSLVTPEEEQRLEEEIERLRRAAQQRVDASSWEAADALREQLLADVSKKSDALKWAEQSLERYSAAAAAGASAASRETSAAELAKALEAIAKSGLLAGAPADLQGLLKAGKLPTDAASMQQLSAALGKYLAETNGRFRALAAGRGGSGKFDVSQFPLESSGDSESPGRGGVTRGRADAELTWGKESAPFDKFKERPLPPGAPRSPDDWAPVVELPGAPDSAATVSTAAAARNYGASAGQSAWRRTLAPRHRSAVKNYFDK